MSKIPDDKKRQCLFCPQVGTRKIINAHVYTHFDSEIEKDYPFLAIPPYNCPECKQSKNWRDRSSLIRHFALVHNVLYKYCDREDSYGSPYKPKKSTRNMVASKKTLEEKKNAKKKEKKKEKKKKKKIMSNGTNSHQYDVQLKENGQKPVTLKEKESSLDGFTRMDEKFADVCSSGDSYSSKNIKSSPISTFDAVNFPLETMVDSPKDTKDNITPNTNSIKRSKHRPQRKKFHCKECSHSTAKLFNLQRHIKCMHIHPQIALRKEHNSLTIIHPSPNPKVRLDVQAISKYLMKKGLTMSDMLKNQTNELLLDNHLHFSKHSQNSLLNGDMGEEFEKRGVIQSSDSEVMQRQFIRNKKCIDKNVQSNYSIINSCNDSDIPLVVSETTSEAPLTSPAACIATKRLSEINVGGNQNISATKFQKLCSESHPSNINGSNHSVEKRNAIKDNHLRISSTFPSINEFQSHIEKYPSTLQKCDSSGNINSVSLINQNETTMKQSNSNSTVKQQNNILVNGTSSKKLVEMKVLPPSNYRCLICNIIVTPGSKKTFNMHLKSCHFNEELLSEFLTKQPPYVCQHNSRTTDSCKAGAKEKQFNSPIDLLDHMIDSHNLVLDMYHERIGSKISYSASSENILSNLPGQTSINRSNNAKNITNSENHTNMCENESIFVCTTCKNKNGTNYKYDLISAYMKYKNLNEESLQKYDFGTPGVFLDEKTLRNHLVDDHFTSLIVKYIEREMKNFLGKFPIVCPLFNCRTIGLSFKEERQFITHFFNAHHEKFDLKAVNGATTDSLLAPIQSSCRRICLDCAYISNGNMEAAVHSCKEHPSRLYGFLTKMGLSKTLLPVKISSLYISSHSEYKVKNNLATLPEISSKNKYASSNQGFVKNTGKRVIEENTYSLLKNKVPKIEKETYATHSQNSEHISHKSQDSIKTNSNSNIENNPNVSENNIESSNDALRPPTKPEMDKFLKDCYSKPFCRCCGSQVWIHADNRGLRLNRLCKHLFREHFFEEIRASILSLIAKMKNTQKCPVVNCPKGEEEYRGVEIMEHMAVFHRRVLVSYWEYVVFKKTRLALSESTNAGQQQWNLSTKLNKLGEESGYDLEIQRIALQRKLRELTNGDVITQPDACFNVSSTLNDCHECWKIRNGVSPRVKGIVCQFAGFRKIRKVQTNFQQMSEFEEAGFLDPYKDPSNTDRSLWTATEEHLDKKMTVDIAEFVVREAGDELCNMLFDEECVIKEFMQDRRRQGKNASILWKRLQPHVREMCDVCSTSLFNIHWTCTSCGCIVCIDCFQTRKKGYPLVYSSVQRNTGKTVAIPHRSRRKQIRDDIDDHFWPYCKNNVPHNPSKFSLTQIICGDICKNILRKMHEVKKRLGMQPKCRCCQPKAERCSTISAVQKPKQATLSKNSFGHEDAKYDKFQINRKLSHSILKIAKLSYDIHSLARCPICKENFNEIRQNIEPSKNMTSNTTRQAKTENQLHMVKHFNGELHSHLKTNKYEGSYMCLLCNKFESHDITMAMMHIGISHNKLIELIGAYLRKNTSTKNINLKIDAETRCKVCKMDYKHHMMTKKCIRIHAMTHFRKHILKEMLINLPNNTASNGYIHKNYTCYVCGVQDTTSSYIINHLGVNHKRLDFYNSFVMDTDLTDYCVNKSAMVSANHIPSRQINYSETILDGVISGVSSTENATQEKCCICDKYFSTGAILAHEVDHFLPELIDYSKMQDGVNIDGNSTYICNQCGYRPPCKTISGIAKHYGSTHGMLKYLLALPELIQRKREQNFGDTSTIKLKMSKFNCQRCYDTLEIGSHDKAVDHFSIHFWCDNTDKLNRSSKQGNNYFQEKGVLDKLEVEYGLSSWLNHHKAYLGSLYSSISNQIRIKFSKRVAHILSGTWCCLCQSVYPNSMFISHYIEHLEPLILKEISGWSLACKQCNGLKTEYSSYKDLKSHYIETHFRHKVISILKDISDVSFVLQLRKEMNVLVLADLDVENEDSYSNEYFKISATNKSITDNFIAANILHACPEEPKPFLQQITSVYGSDVSKQSSECGYSTSKCSPPFSSGRTEEKFSVILSPEKDTIKKGNSAILDNSGSSDSPRTQYNSVSIHLSEQDAEHVSAPHKWLCEGRLLLLSDPIHPKNIYLFKSQWRLGQPVLIANSSEHLNKQLWHPEAFLQDFGHLRHDLVNCLTGQTVPKASLDIFWRGFSWIKHRLKDATGTPMLMKLKDWPPSSDIAEYMPKRFADLFRAFPMKNYTMREGTLNLAGYLPEYCLKPELGPKMYIAYGSALYSGKASTNLHIDMSDAVNCLVYVGFPKDGNREENAKQVLAEIDKAGCDILMKRRVRSKDTLPGALWHIFHPKHTVVIRNFLNQVALENGKRLDPHDDPIHDQSTYLDQKLRMRLYNEYGIQGYAIVQCAGDTVFIPAGACHQVRNLHNCIKIAEDFVSPENISHCLHLTQEFRQLTEWHTNHEDKLQIKSILYHAVKSAITVLLKKEESLASNNDNPKATKMKGRNEN